MKGFSFEEIKGAFGETLSYDEVMEIRPLLNPLEQEGLKKFIAEKQREFWSNSKMMDYYVKDHPRLPPVPPHFKSLLRTIDPKGRRDNS